jgi:hypothetical protein
MHRTEQQEQQPKGPTTGPIRPLIVVMETTDGQEEEPLPEQEKLQQRDDEQDRLPPIPEDEKRKVESGTPPALPQQNEPNGPEPTPPPREPRPLSLPVVAARTPRSFSLLVAYLPAGNLPDVGIATVPARAVQVGPQGNSAPLDLNGLCCVAGVSVKNTNAFVGGQNARDYPVVARQDVEAVTEQESTALTQQAQASLQGEVRPNEQLASPAQCHPALHTDHPIGSEATHVTITLTVTCQAEVYDAPPLAAQPTHSGGEHHRNLERDHHPERPGPYPDDGVGDGQWVG